MRYFMATLAAFTALFALAPARAQQHALAVSEIAPGVFMHEGRIALMSSDNEGAIANIGFIIGEQTVAVIDNRRQRARGEGNCWRRSARRPTSPSATSSIPTATPITSSVTRLPFTAEGAEFVGHRQLPQALAARGPFYLEAFARSMGRELMSDVRIVPPTGLVDGSLTLDLGGRTIIVKAWPVAHSDSDVTVFDTTSKMLFAGDLVFLRHIPVVDGSIKTWLRIIDDLAALPAERVVPGHGPVSEWPNAIANERHYLGTLASDYRRDIADGKPIGVSAEHAAANERSKWDLFDDYNTPPTQLQHTHNLSGNKHATR